jgi:hypothetical protein
MQFYEWVGEVKDTLTESQLITEMANEFEDVSVLAFEREFVKSTIGKLYRGEPLRPASKRNFESQVFQAALLSIPTHNENPQLNTLDKISFLDHAENEIKVSSPLRLEINNRGEINAGQLSNAVGTQAVLNRLYEMDADDSLVDSHSYNNARMKNYASNLEELIKKETAGVLFSIGVNVEDILKNGPLIDELKRVGFDSVLIEADNVIQYSMPFYEDQLMIEPSPDGLELKRNDKSQRALNVVKI